MSSENKNIDNHLFYKNNLFQFTLIGILIGLAFPFIAWIIDIILNDIKFSYKEIWEMHIETPIHFIIDLAPFVLGLIFFLFIKKKKK